MIARSLLNAKAITVAVVTITIIIVSIIAMSTKSKLPTSEIEKTAKAHEYLFIIYLLFLAATVVLTYMVWRSGNKYQEVIKLDADAKIATANTEIKRADEKIAALTTQAEFLKTEAVRAKEGIAKANEKTEELKKRNLELESTLEKERTERIQMEAAIAPRVIEQRQSSKELEQFHGISVIIESLAESEPWRVAGQIAWLLANAKWNVLPGMKRFLDATMFFDGVTVETNVGARPREDRSSEAADALVAVLIKNKIQAHRRPSSENLPLNTIKVRVGLKPAEYFERSRKDFEYGNMLYR